MKLVIILVGVLIVALAAYLGVYYYTMSTVKEPSYTVVAKNAPIEIRDYKKMVLAEVLVKGTRDDSINLGFRKLADYIFGSNDKDIKIPMTAPVMQQQEGDGMWQVRFVMPENFDLTNLPKPKNADIKILEQNSVTMAVIRFSGSLSTGHFDKKLKLLEAYLNQNNYQSIGKPIFAYYNPPWTLPFMRRNEILITIKKLTKSG